MIVSITTFSTNYFLVALDVVASSVHLKIKHHNDFGRPVVVKVNLRKANRIYEAILKNLFTITLVPGGRVAEVDGASEVLDFDICKDEPLQRYKLGHLTRIKTKNPKPFLDGDFEASS